jgi:hypothetical protein
VRGHTPPPSSQPLEAPRGPRGENSWSGDTSRRRRWLWRDLDRTSFATFLEIEFPKSVERRLRRRKHREVPRAGRSTRKAGGPVVFGVSRLPFLPAGRPAFWGERGLRSGVIPVSTRGQADAQRGQSVGSTVSSECRRSTGLPGGETRSSVRSSDSARISSACAEGSSLPAFRSSGRRGSARLRTRLASGSSRMPIGVPGCGRCDPTPEGGRPPPVFQHGAAPLGQRLRPRASAACSDQLGRQRTTPGAETPGVARRSPLAAELPGCSWRSCDRSRRSRGRDSRSPHRSGTCTGTRRSGGSTRRSGRSGRSGRNGWRYRRSNAIVLVARVLGVAGTVVFAASTPELGPGVTVRMHVAVGVRVGAGLRSGDRRPAHGRGHCSCDHETGKGLLHDDPFVGNYRLWKTVPDPSAWNTWEKGA